MVATRHRGQRARPKQHSLRSRNGEAFRSSYQRVLHQVLPKRLALGSTQRSVSSADGTRRCRRGVP